jgi:hypothetical protein
MESPKPKNNLTVKAIWASILIVAFYAVFTNARFLMDEYTIWRNPPAAEIVEMAEKTTMNDYAKRLFYASTPSLETAAAFNEHCAGAGEEMVLLGCYYQGKIYIFDINDPEIAGARYVTAAHEMLHAAYSRLDYTEKTLLETRLESMYQQLNDTELNELIANYDKTEPGEKYNELHSILGTEYADLSPELESYYAKYFTNQDAVAELSVQYKKVFKDIENAQSELKTKMEALLAKIDDDKANYEAQANQLNADIMAFNFKSEAGGFTTDSQFKTARDALLARQSALDEAYNQIQADINQYNTWVLEYNKLGGRAQELNKSFNSNAAELNGG